MTRRQAEVANWVAQADRDPRGPGDALQFEASQLRAKAEEIVPRRHLNIVYRRTGGRGHMAAPL